MVKQIHNLVLTRASTNEAFGFRIIGGKDEGLSFKVGKVVTGSPANEAGVQVGDFLVSVQGQDVFDCDHASVVRTIRGAGKCLNLAVERGDHIVPNFEEIWPSGRKKKEGARMSDGRGVDHVMQAMKEGLPGSKDQKFTTVGKPKIEVNSQYDNPIECYSEDALKEMSENSSTWKVTPEQVALMPPVDQPKLTSETSAVLAVLEEQQKRKAGQVPIAAGAR